MAATQAVHFWSVCDDAAEALGIHCGLPQGIMRQHITTTYEPLSKLLEKLNPKTRDEEDITSLTDELGQTWTIRQQWKVKRPYKGLFGLVIIFQNRETGKCRKVFIPQDPCQRRLDMITWTMARRANFAFRESEQQAQRRLFRELSDDQRDQYVTADGFLELGRSGVYYLIRKNRPTIAFREDKNGGGDPLCALCLHPVAYYTDTWAGVLPPSDEVLAHLLMIRDSEKFYWRKANQMPLEHENSGV